MNKHSLQIITHQQPQEQALESSIQKLIKSSLRRQKFKSLFFTTNPSTHQETTPPWRNKLVDFLESKRVRFIALSLLLVDLILTTLELTSSLVSCHASNKSHREQGHETTWYHWLGVAILGLLFAKTLAVAVAVGPASFLRTRPGLLVDGVVLAVALFMETFLERKGGALVVVVSLWRLVRVVESAFELSDDAIEAQIKGIVAQFESFKEEKKRLAELVADKDKVIQKLQADLDRCREQGYCPLA